MDTVFLLSAKSTADGKHGGYLILRHLISVTSHDEAVTVAVVSLWGCGCP